MRLEEIQASSAAEQRVKRLKANAKAAKDRAKKLKAQADASADQLAMQQARKQLSMARKAQPPMIKTHS
jgi:hypothetical protein